MSKRFEIQGEGRRYAALLLALGFMHLALYYLADAAVNGPGPLAIPQPDAPLYYQAARRICEGYPFSFTVGNAVSTGTTSVLYPFVLAVPYALGFTGDALVSAGFLLNALFYLIFLGGWGFAFWRWLTPKTALFATTLLALFPQTAFCACAQSDTGVWMALSALCVAGLSCGNAWLYGPLLLVAPWVRPEGFILNFAVLLISCASITRFLGGKQPQIPRTPLIFAILGIVSALCVALFNHHLTGVGGFSSVANKGYFTTHPFVNALAATFSDGVRLLREIILGSATTSPRFAYSIPILSALVFSFGLFTYRTPATNRVWPKSLIVFTLASLGNFLVVASSGWEGSNTDRYLAWIMPILIFFTACGWWEFSTRLHTPTATHIMRIIPIVFSTGMALYLLTLFHLQCHGVDQVDRFAKRIEESTYRTASIGSFGWCGLAYRFGERRLAHLSGIYSQEFATRNVECVFEILKNEPHTRFDYWLLSVESPVPATLRHKLGPCELVGPDGFELRKADWSAFTEAAKPPHVHGKRLVARVDVGYEADERAARYEAAQRYNQRPFEPIVQSANSAHGRLFEVGRLVTEHDEMNISNLVVGRDVRVILRTINAVDAVSVSPWHTRLTTKYAFDDELDLHAAVDGTAVACCHAHISTNGFSDTAFTIPGKAITASSHRISFHGEHVAFGYWFYQ